MFWEFRPKILQHRTDMSVYSWIRNRPLADFGNLSRMARGISAPLIIDKVRSDQQTKVVLAGEPEEHPLPSDPKAIFVIRWSLRPCAAEATAFVAREIKVLLRWSLLSFSSSSLPASLAGIGAVAHTAIVLRRCC